jgi:hypothetical protein
MTTCVLEVRLHIITRNVCPTDEISQPPFQIPVVKPDLDRANPKVGVSSLAFSADGRYLATKNGRTSQRAGLHPSSIHPFHTHHY